MALHFMPIDNQFLNQIIQPVGYILTSRDEDMNRIIEIYLQVSKKVAC